MKKDLPAWSMRLSSRNGYWVIESADEQVMHFAGTLKEVHIWYQGFKASVAAQKKLEQNREISLGEATLEEIPDGTAAAIYRSFFQES